jgi:hypothetical protein
MSSFNIALQGKVKPRSALGLVVGKEIELSWEVTNLSTGNFLGGILQVHMESPDGHVVTLPSRLPSLKPNERIIVDRDLLGNPLITHVHAQGFTLFYATIGSTINVVIQTPSGNIVPPNVSFFSFFGKTKEELYSLWALIVAVAGLAGTFVLTLIQLLHDFNVF